MASLPSRCDGQLVLPPSMRRGPRPALGTCPTEGRTMRNRQRASTPLESTTNSDRRLVMNYVGFDWASRAHDVTVLDEAGGVLDRWAFPHSETGWVTTLDRLARHGSAVEVPVIIERTSGLIVDRLLAAGHPVVPVHPTAFYAARPRWGASGAKSDPGDSYKLADYLRTDGHRLRRLTDRSRLARTAGAGPAP